MLEKTKFNFKKQFGQNFIFDKNFLLSLVKLFDLPTQTNVLEIGPGAGTLTEVLAKNFKKVLSIEIDKTLQENLLEIKQNYNNLDFWFKDVLKVNTEDIESYFNGENFVIIANLPYYITSQIVFKFLFEAKFLTKMFVMVQKEVGLRYCAKENSKEYGIPTIILNTFGNVKILKNVDKKMFTPMPKVDSCMIEIDIDKNKFGINDFDKYCNFVSNCFKMRRKTLQNNLTVFGFEKQKIKDTFNALNLEQNVRPENLSCEQFVNLFNLINK